MQMSVYVSSYTGKMRPWTLLCVTLLLYSVTGGVYAHLRSWIVGGNNAHKGEWPWMVYLQMDEVRCGGSLVSDQWVMTAAHCWSKTYKLEHSFARVGELSLKKPSGRKVKLKQVVTHPEFHIDNKKRMYFNDIAMVQLQECVSFSNTVSLVTLPDTHDHFSDDSECWVTGWGLTKDNKPLGGNETLQEVQLPLVDDVMCMSVYSHLDPHTHLCAGDLNGEKDSCMGDSGGPLVCVPVGEQKRGFVQVGIVSFGKDNQCALKGTPGVYTRVSSYTDFINKHINRN